MSTGMLWFDRDPTSELFVKVEQAAIYYQTRYGQKPNLCFVHPSLLNNNNSVSLPFMSSAGIEILPSQQVKPDQLWMGVRELISTM